jgi:hypothetical protein
VFLLDPWWNPAAEAQAVDRAHRIGQTQQGHGVPADHARTPSKRKCCSCRRRSSSSSPRCSSADQSLLAKLTREDLAALLA